MEIFCDIHSDMNGVVLVVPNAYYAIPDEQGNNTISNVPNGEYVLAAGLYFELKTGFIQIHTEFIISTWESPYIVTDELLTLYSGYLEGRYDVLPNLYIAARADIVEYSNLRTDDPAGEETWGDPLRRIELGIGYRLTREVLLKAVYQQNDHRSTYALSGLTDKEVIALQLHMVF